MFLDASPGVAAKALEVLTPTPGFSAQVYAADNINLGLPYGDSTSLKARGWQGPIGVDSSVASGAKIRLQVGGHQYRFYLLWITELPPGSQSVTLAELTLYR